MKIESNGVRIHVRDSGDGDLALVFLHYWGGSSRTWRYVIDALGDALGGGCRTVAYDHRGWGQSDAPAEGYAIGDLADDAQNVIRALGLRRYVIVGHSMGGKVAQCVAARRPAGLEGLVLVAPSPPIPMAIPDESRAAMASAYDSRESIEGVLDAVLTARALSIEAREQVIADSLGGASQAKIAWPTAAMREDISEAVHSEANLSPKEKVLNRFRPVRQTAPRYGVVLGGCYLSTAASTCSRRIVSPIADARSGFA